jgi:hypothetical protein
MVKNAIDRDIAAQQANIAGADKQIHGKMSELGFLQSRLRDPKLAMEVYRSSILDEFKLASEEGRAKAATHIGQSIADQVASTADLMLADNMRKVDLAAQDKVVEQRSSTKSIGPARVIGGSGSPSWARKLDKNTARKIAEEHPKILDGLRNLQELEALLLKAGKFPNFFSKWPSSGEAKTLDMKIRKAALATRKAMGDTGPVVVSDFDNYDPIGRGIFQTREVMLSRTRSARTKLYRALSDQALRLKLASDPSMIIKSQAHYDAMAKKAAAAEKSR